MPYFFLSVWRLERSLMLSWNNGKKARKGEILSWQMHLLSFVFSTLNGKESDYSSCVVFFLSTLEIYIFLHVTNTGSAHLIHPNFIAYHGLNSSWKHLQLSPYYTSVCCGCKGDADVAEASVCTCTLIRISLPLSVSQNALFVLFLLFHFPMHKYTQEEWQLMKCTFPK